VTERSRTGLKRRDMGVAARDVPGDVQSSMAAARASGALG
jgi:hypothetical protein